MSSVAAREQGAVAVDRCPMCGDSGATIAAAEGPYVVRRCAACTFGYVTPRLPEDGLAAIYDRDSYWRSPAPRTLGYHDYRADEALYLRTFARRLDHVLRGGPSGGVALDVGCAAGFCMEVLRARGFEVHGVELSAAIAEHARERFGLETIHVGTLDGAPFADASFDLVTIWDVVEHVVDPRALLRRARELLKDSGMLVLETQDIDSAFARALGRRWHHFKHAEHIYHFNPRTISSLLCATGFEVERLTHRYGGKYVSFQFIAERAARLHPSLSVALSPLARIRAARVYLNFMDEMVVLARPR
jgi:2-polyprenyl-3-methyl-5-hydroxy-6-metoxy-1,4-benzoquinol methylase